MPASEEISCNHFQPRVPQCGYIHTFVLVTLYCRAPETISDLAGDMGILAKLRVGCPVAHQACKLSASVPKTGSAEGAVFKLDPT